MYDFKFGDGSLGKLYGVTTSRPPREVATYDFKLVEMPGKSGADYIDNKRYGNVEFTREIGFANRAWGNIPEICEHIIEWLAYQTGYQDFEDTDHPDMVTKACLKNFSEVNIVLRRIHKAKLKFSRIPFWYKKPSLELKQYTPAQAAAGIAFNNPFPINSRPFIDFYLQNGATHDLVFTLGGETYTFPLSALTTNSTQRRYVHCDCETGNVVISDSPTSHTKYYADLDAPDGFPVGASELKVTSGDLLYVYVAPRWRCL